MKDVISSALFGLLTTVFYCMIALNSAWQTLLPLAQELKFGDLHVLTVAAGCFGDSQNYGYDGKPCDDWISMPYPPAPYNYPAAWAKILGVMHVSERSTFALGMAFIVLFSLAIAILVYLVSKGNRGSVWPRILVGSLAFTPASMLALERGNFDVLVFTVLIVGLALTLTSKITLSIITVVAAALLKLFPVGAILVFTARPDRKIRYFVAALVGFTVGVTIYIQDFNWILNRTPQTFQVSFGSAVIPLKASQLFGFTLEPSSARFVGTLITGSLVLLVLLARKLSQSRKFGEVWDKLIVDVARDSVTRHLLIIGVFTFTTSYSLGTNFDYRLIFSFPIIAAVVRLVFGGYGRLWPLLVFLFIGVFSSAQKDEYLPNYVSDVIFLMVIPVFLVFAFELIKATRAAERVSRTHS